MSIDLQEPTTHTKAGTLSAIWICDERGTRAELTLARYLDALSATSQNCDLTIVCNAEATQTIAAFQARLEESKIEARMICLHRACDHSAEIQAGLDASDGETIVLLPPYIQSDPDALHRMLEEIENGADYVASWRTPRVDSWWNGFKSRVFNFITRRLTGIKLHDVNSGMRVMSRQLTDHVPIYGDLDRFWPFFANAQGYKIVEVKTRHIEERVKRGDYRLGVYMRRLLDVLALFFLIKFTRKPLRFFGLIGGSTFLAGATITAVLVAQRLFGSPLADRPALIFGVLLIVLGIQLFSLGLLGELLIFTHGKAVRDYHVQRVWEEE